MNKSVAISELTAIKSFGLDFLTSIGGMFKDRNDALEKVSSLDHRVRCAALESLVKFWMLPCGELKPYFEQLLSDENEDVRVFSIVLLAGTSFDRATCDWIKERLDMVLQMPSVSDRERTAAKLGLGLRSHRVFRDKAGNLVDDTAALISKWDQLGRANGNGRINGTLPDEP